MQSSTTAPVPPSPGPSVGDSFDDRADPLAGVELSDRGREMLAEIVRWSRSGQSIRAWCRQRGIKFSTLGWWKRRLVEQGVDIDAVVRQADALDLRIGRPAAEEEATPRPVGLRGSCPPIPVIGDLPAPDDPAALNAPALFLNRELTWLSFNHRVLHEASDPRTPLLDRVKFLAIVGSNLDEFFMKRIGGLKQQAGAGLLAPTVDGRTPAEQIESCSAVVRDLRRRMERIYLSLVDALAAEGVELLRWTALTDADRQELRDRYRREVFPLVTPLSIDPAHPFPFVSNLSLNLLVVLRPTNREEPTLARIKIPTAEGTPRFMRLSEGDRFVPLDDIVAHNLDLLFPGLDVLGCYRFRVTRNANTELDEEEADDLLGLIETELRMRKFAPIVRLELEPGTPAIVAGRLAAEFGLDPELDVYEGDGLLGVRDLMQVVGVERPDLKLPPHHPIDHESLRSHRSIFHIIRSEGSLLLHHPYQAFATSVERFLKEASRDPKVRAIKATIYRTAEDSAVVGYLMDAARNGKQVAVVVELKARFDEEANIRWANKLESMGIHVNYGVVGFKTHCKVVLVVRQDYDGLRRYAHLGTGNYHAGTARLYTDFGLLTSDPQVGADLTELFNYLTTGYAPRRRYQALLVSPEWLKQGLLSRIAREIRLHRTEAGGHIRIKTNALEDVDVTRALYQASQAGVRVELVVRDTCRLRPGLPGFSDNITVTSVVGRFLEHARVLYFRNGGQPEYYIGSADSMKRNLESRVEVMVPVRRAAHRVQLDEMFEVQLADQRSAWRMAADGSYRQRWPDTPEGDGHGVAAHDALIAAVRLRAEQPVPGAPHPLAAPVPDLD